MLERTHLEIIQTVDRVGTVTEAANELFLTQSAISHSIKKLEQQLGVKFWEKDGRRLRLTQAGQYLLDLAHRLLPQLENAESLMQDFAAGRRGTLRIGMECHPCYRWLLRVVDPFLKKWPLVDVDVRPEFQFGGIMALLNYDIDLLVTPDPQFKSELLFEPAFDYELVLVVSVDHHLSKKRFVKPDDLSTETLIAYPVSIERLDIYRQFLIPAGMSPQKHKTIETTDIMLQMVANNRGVTALPGWLVDQYKKQMNLRAIKIGKQGIQKQIFVGVRKTDAEIDYLKSFVRLSKNQ